MPVRSVGQDTGLLAARVRPRGQDQNCEQQHVRRLTVRNRTSAIVVKSRGRLVKSNTMASDITDGHACWHARVLPRLLQAGRTRLPCHRMLTCVEGLKGLPFSPCGCMATVRREWCTSVREQALSDGAGRTPVARPAKRCACCRLLLGTSGSPVILLLPYSHTQPRPQLPSPAPQPAPPLRNRSPKPSRPTAPLPAPPCP